MQTEISLYMLPASGLGKLVRIYLHSFSCFLLTTIVSLSYFRERFYIVHRLNPGPGMVREPRPEQHIRRRQPHGRSTTNGKV
ncbi:hypothetical protein K443DRAFT_94095 [Laccaria amethystina LaAM-08-1]|uniref:Uncharacterized protein n=1 Tax=Laccaria amethystina LaAM-08-1 TaxID=1095629 RepID=A0A0C9WWC4_9AGAR|nr:hypothetical protein K443DRAFT_94095 [Laccaria amethystina LaAM-08-1]